MSHIKVGDTVLTSDYIICDFDVNLPRKKMKVTEIYELAGFGTFALLGDMYWNVDQITTNEIGELETTPIIVKTRSSI